MSIQTKSGFTIIEVMLFLAITGALAVAILVGSGAAIGQQRYRDSVSSFKGVIQEQYGQVANVISSEASNPVCVPSEETLVFDVDSERPRGTSECLILGRFALVEATKVTAYNLVGQPVSDTPGEGDTATFQGYALALQAPREHDINWGSRIVEPNSTDGSLASIVIARSPLSGTILTYILNGDHRSNVKAVISDSNMAEKIFCVDAGGGPLTSSPLAVRINARAASQSAVEIPLEEENVCG